MVPRRGRAIRRTITSTKEMKKEMNDERKSEVNDERKSGDQEERI